MNEPTDIEEMAHILINLTKIKKEVVGMILEFLEPNCILTPAIAGLGPVALDVHTGCFVRVYGRRWKQERSWEIAQNSQILIRCGAALNAIGVDKFSTMVGDRRIGNYIKVRGEVIAVKIFIGHPPGFPSECGIAAISFKDAKTGIWSVRFGATAGFNRTESWPIVAVRRVGTQEKTFGTQQTSVGSQVGSQIGTQGVQDGTQKGILRPRWKLTGICAFSASTSNGVVGALKTKWDRVYR
ncbi:hypothetical protein AAMO2058_000538600 [Amorphochlora amoebiformis]